jgi:hypothetical protein
VSQLHGDEEVEEEVVEVEDVKVVEVVEEEPVEEVVVEEVVEEVAEVEVLMTINDVRDRVAGIVNNARTAGLTAITSRGFAALEGFFGALAGDKEKRPPPKE